MTRRPVVTTHRQAKAFCISGCTLHYLPRSVPPQSLSLNRRIDELQHEYLFVCSRMLLDD
ncbi:hypothetical protein [Dyella choica]|uniref:Uncharacterized protein n=1 Tax=Dyella choica TaxID=1927959 RepID=A0A3S0RJP2_9GAMM|nr:hypothetical protein [Dyella choica]RUL74046.1 hypothetical protein EKH80_14530 [Dyella choica]